MRRRFEVNTGLVVVGWPRYVNVREIFIREFNSSDSLDRVGIETKAEPTGQKWPLFVWYESDHKFPKETTEMYRSFLRGVIATSQHYDPLGEYSTTG